MTIDVSLIVPVYNEETRLPGFVEAVAPQAGTLLCAGYRLAEIVVVDDGSTDATAHILGSLDARDGWSVVGSLGGNLGKGNAIKRGVAAAGGDVVLFSDVDLAVPLDEAHKLFAELDAGVALAFASRDMAQSDVTAPWGRMVCGRIFNLLVRRSTGLTVRDSQCGFKAMSTTLAKSLLADQEVPGLAFDVELLLMARANGQSMVEVAVRYIHEPGSKVRPLRHAPRMAVEVVRLGRRFQKQPAMPTLADPAHGIS